MDSGGVALVFDGPVTDLPLLVKSPAPGCARRRDRAYMPPHADALEGESTCNGNGNGAARIRGNRAVA